MQETGVDVPDDRRYTEQHEWAWAVDGQVRIGITDYAQEALGDIVHVEFVAAEGTIEAGAMVAEVESIKSVAEVYTPGSGDLQEVNTEVSERPELVNEEPYGAGWFVSVAPTDIGAIESLLDAAAYRALLE